MRHFRHSAAQRGYSLIELMVVVGMAGITIGAITRFAFKARLEMLRQEGAGELYMRNSRIGMNLRATLQSAKLLVARYPGGAPDYTLLHKLVADSAALGGAPTPATFSTPPLVATMHEPDLTETAAGLWGDEIMLVAGLSPISFTATSSGPGGCTETISADRLQFVYIYLGQVPGQRLPTGGPALRMVEWRSQPVIAYSSLSGYNNASCALRASGTATALLAMGYHTAYDTANPTPNATAFFQIVAPASAGPAGLFVSGTASIPGSLAQGSWAYLDDFDYVQSYRAAPGLNQNRLSHGESSLPTSGPASFSMAYDTVNPTVSPTMKMPALDAPGGKIVVPKYCPADENAAGFPGGFEVAVAGAANAREVYVRHVMTMVGATRANSNAAAYMAHEKTDDIAINVP